MNVEERARVYLQSHEDASPASLAGHLGIAPDEAASLYERLTATTEDSDGTCECTGETRAVDVDAGVVPKSMKRRHEWLTWKQTPDGRKIPRAPWEIGRASCRERVYCEV